MIKKQKLPVVDIIDWKGGTKTLLKVHKVLSKQMQQSIDKALGTSKICPKILISDTNTEVCEHLLLTTLITVSSAATLWW